VLSALADLGPRTQIEPATALSIDRTAMVYLLDELERKKLVERVRNPDDRRSFLVHLTPKGEKRQRKAASELAAQTEVLLEPLEAAERRRLVELLTRIADHWEQLNTTPP
jgi:DNA-binding MarR family transcriptional regulator